MSQKRQPKGIPVGGEFASNEHDEASLSLTSVGEADAVAIPDALRGEEMFSGVFRDDSLPHGFYCAAAKVMGIMSVYYFDEDSRIVGRSEDNKGRTNFYSGGRLKGGELTGDVQSIFHNATYGAIPRLPGGDKRPGFAGADAGLMGAQDRLRDGLFSDRAADAALIVGVMEGQLSRGVSGKDAYTELRAWSYASQSNPEFRDGIEETIVELYGDTPMADIPKKRPKIAALVRWEDSVSSTGTISASRRRGRMIAAAVLSGQSKWWNLRDRAQEIVEE